MPGNKRQSQQKQTDDTTKKGLTPLTFSTDQRRSNEQRTEDELLTEDDPLASTPPRPPTSTIRWNNSTTGRRGTGKREVTTETPYQQTPVPPRRTAHIRNPLPDPMQARSPSREPRNVHWMLYVGIGMIAALALWVSASSLLAWGTNKYNDIVYGNPRLFQMDAVVGHNNDSPAHQSHFIALNLHGQVIVIELPAGDPTRSIDYIGPELIAPGNDQIPITLTFSDVNKDGKRDMIIHIGDKEIHFCNNGTKFTAC